MDGKIFYRVANIETNQGLWYDWDGKFTGLINNRFDFCANKDLPMPYDKELVGWISAVDELEQLWFWFTKNDVYRLQQNGWYVYVYQTERWKMYDYDEEVSHTVIDKESSTPILRVIINDSLEIGTIEEVKSPQRVAIKQ